MAFFLRSSVLKFGLKSNYSRKFAKIHSLISTKAGIQNSNEYSTVLLNKDEIPIDKIFSSCIPFDGVLLVIGPTQYVHSILDRSEYYQIRGEFEEYGDYEQPNFDYLQEYVFGDTSITHIVMPLCTPTGFIYPVSKLIKHLRLKRPDISTIVDCSSGYNIIESEKYSNNIDYLFSSNIYPLLPNENVPFVLAKNAPFLSKSGLIRNDREIGDTLYEIWKSQQQQSDEEYDDKINHIANILKIDTKSYYRSIVNDIEEYMLKLGFLPGKLCSTDTENPFYLRFKIPSRKLIEKIGNTDIVKCASIISDGKENELAIDSTRWDNSFFTSI